jgi:outer membrane lipoprotein-sorting protein
MRSWLAAAVMLASADARAQQPLSPAQVAAQVHKTYASAKTFEAALTETLTTHNGGTATSKPIRTGRLRTARGGKFRFDATNGDVGFSDGTIVYSYEAAVHTAYRMAPRKSAAVAALSFLERDLSQDFRLSFSNLFKPNPTTAFLLIGEPLVRTPQLQLAAFWITASMEVRRVAIIDDQGNQTSFDLAAPRINPTLAPATFQWAPPAGAKIITI